MVRPKRRDAQGLVARDRSGGVGLPRFGGLARRDDRGRATCGNGVMALAGVEGAVGGDAADRLIGRDLVAQFGQHGRIADVTGGEPGRPDFEGSDRKSVV